MLNIFIIELFSRVREKTFLLHCFDCHFVKKYQMTLRWIWRSASSYKICTCNPHVRIQHTAAHKPNTFWLMVNDTFFWLWCTVHAVLCAMLNEKNYGFYSLSVSSVSNIYNSFFLSAQRRAPIWYVKCRFIMLFLFFSFFVLSFSLLSLNWVHFTPVYKLNGF